MFIFIEYVFANDTWGFHNAFKKETYNLMNKDYFCFGLLHMVFVLTFLGVEYNRINLLPVF